MPSVVETVAKPTLTERIQGLKMVITNTGRQKSSYGTLFGSRNSKR